MGSCTGNRLATICRYFRGRSDSGTVVNPSTMWAEPPCGQCGSQLRQTVGGKLQQRDDVGAASGQGLNLLLGAVAGSVEVPGAPFHRDRLSETANAPRTVVRNGRQNTRRPSPDVSDDGRR